MQIVLHQLGKRFNRQWVFRRLDAQWQAGTAYAITGHNGSGKSTLLQIIGGLVEKSEGTITYTLGGNNLPEEDWYKHISICAPYQELIEELTLEEFLQFHARFKPWLPGLSIGDIIARLGLQAAARKPIHQFSSGMKQRVKLAQALLSDVAIVLLDEPTSNLDAEGIALYHQLVHTQAAERIILIASNDEQEIGFCLHRLDITQYKIA